MKDFICTGAGLIGGAIAAAFGGWDAAVITLIIFLATDWIMGIIIAGVFKASPKTANGALCSKVGWKGLCKKCITLVFVIIAERVDLLLNSNFVRDAVIVGFCANELISIVENAGYMGIPIPKPILNAIEVLKEKAGESDDD